MQKVLIVDHDKCTGCKVCEIICSLYKEDEVNPMKSRVHVVSWETEGTDIPMICHQCEKAPCAEICPVQAIARDPDTGALIIDEKSCIGCRMCIHACPFGAPSVRPDTGKVIKCDLCHGDPKCVQFCVTGALQFQPASKAVLLKKRAAAKKFGDLMVALNLPPADEGRTR
jgi:Fe-S-cluster-containing dehydrogenase component